MAVTALFLDLDHTIFPTQTIGYEVFKPVFDSLDMVSPFSKEEMAVIKDELWKHTFFEVATEYGFSNEMKQTYLYALNSITFDFNISPYPDYCYLNQNKLPKYLITSGTTRVQEAKIKSLNLATDFKKICIDDANLRAGGKTSVFQELVAEENLLPAEVLVIGDNPDAEIAAGNALGMHTVLIDRDNTRPGNEVLTSFEFLDDYLKKL